MLSKLCHFFAKKYLTYTVRQTDFNIYTLIKHKKWYNFIVPNFRLQGKVLLTSIIKSLFTIEFSLDTFNYEYI